MIYIIRHGQTDWNLEKKMIGQIDVPLNQTGKEQAKASIKQLSALKIDEIISSDLVRTKETADIINTALHLPISFDARLRERNYGDLEGISEKDISQETWSIFNKDPHKMHAESPEDLYKRVKSFFNEVDSSKNILVVTHSGVLRMAMLLLQHPRLFSKKAFLTAQQFRAKNAVAFKWNAAGLSEYTNSAQKVR